MNKGRIEKFTPSQEIALERIDAFMKMRITGDVNSRVLVIRGSAGTGKSTIVKYAFEELIEKDRENLDKDVSTFDMFSNPEVVGVALAHKAKNNLSKSIHICKTFASFFGMKESHGDEGQRTFEIDPFMKKSALCKSPLKAVVHDEASMYDFNMVKICLEETNRNTKMIFMGDPNQLPPINTVGDEDSPVFSMFTNVIYLDERVRQTEGNPIIELSDVFIEEIRSGQNVKRVLEAMKNSRMVNDTGFQSVRYREYREHYKSKNDYMEAKIIAYRRDTVQKFNVTTRNFIHNNPTELYIPGEIVYMNDTFMQEDKTTGAYGEPISEYYYCYNSDEYKILRVEEGAKEGVDVFKIYFDASERNDLENIESPHFVVVRPQGMAKYKEVHNYRRKAAIEASSFDKKKKWKYFYDFKNKFADCSYGYALTGHKAQGSGYREIYVDVNDILSVGPISDKRKLQALYTAITRATHEVNLLKKN